VQNACAPEQPAGKFYPHETGIQETYQPSKTVKRRFLTEREVERLMDCARN